MIMGDPQAVRTGGAQPCVLAGDLDRSFVAWPPLAAVVETPVNPYWPWLQPRRPAVNRQGAKSSNNMQEVSWTHSVAWSDWSVPKAASTCAACWPGGSPWTI